MKLKLTWVNESIPGGYVLDESKVDTEEQSLRDKVVSLLCYSWDTFGEPGDCIKISEITEEE